MICIYIYANFSWARNTSESMQHLLHAIHAIAWKTQNGLFGFETVCHTVKNRYYTAACVHLYYIRGLLHALHVITRLHTQKAHSSRGV